MMTATRCHALLQLSSSYLPRAEGGEESRVLAYDKNILPVPYHYAQDSANNDET